MKLNESRHDMLLVVEMVCIIAFMEFFAFVLLPYSVGENPIWQKSKNAIITDECIELTHPEIDIQHEQLYQHCISYPETYGVKP